MKKRSIILTSLIILAIFVRIYKIDNPIAEWHSWRQADTASVTKNFEVYGFNPFIPHYFDISNVQSGKENPEGYRFVEFPIYQVIVYIIKHLFYFLPLSYEIWHRIISIIFSIFTLYFIYKIGLKTVGDLFGIISAFWYAFLPYSIFYSRSILPETIMNFLITFFLFIQLRFMKKRAKISISSLILLTCTLTFLLLIKPTALFFIMPFFVYGIYIFVTRPKKKILFFYGMILCISGLIFLLWRLWASQFPEGIPAWQWLVNGHTLSLEGNMVSKIAHVISFLFGYQKGGIRYRPSFFYWIVYKRLIELILGYIGIVFALLGGWYLLNKKTAFRWFYLSLIVGAMLYVTVIAEGNVRHDYYQIPLLIPLSFTLSFGVTMLVEKIKNKRYSFFIYTFILILIGASFSNSWQKIRTYYWINNYAIVKAGKRADEIIPKYAKVIAPYGGDTAFLYHVNRKGWPVGFDIEDKVKQGASYYISVTPKDPEVSYVKAHYTTIEETNEYVIVKLQ